MAINTVLLKGRGERVEAKAAGTITPGDIVRFNTAGALIRNSTAKAQLPFCIATENDLEGKEITDDYVSGDFVQAEVLRSGHWAYCFVAANAAAIVIGDILELDGAGGLRKQTAEAQLTSGNYTYTAPGAAMGVALDALDNSAVAAKARIRVQVI